MMIQNKGKIKIKETQLDRRKRKKRRRKIKRKLNQKLRKSH